MFYYIITAGVHLPVAVGRTSVRCREFASGFPRTVSPARQPCRRPTYCRPRCTAPKQHGPHGWWLMHHQVTSSLSFNKDILLPILSGPLTKWHPPTAACIRQTYQDVTGCVGYTSVFLCLRHAWLLRFFVESWCRLGDRSVGVQKRGVW